MRRQDSELPTRTRIDPARHIEAITGVTEQAFDDAGRAYDEGVIGCGDIGRFGRSPDTGNRTPDCRIFLRQEQDLDGLARRRDQDPDFLSATGHVLLMRETSRWRLDFRQDGARGANSV